MSAFWGPQTFLPPPSTTQLSLVVDHIPRISTINRALVDPASKFPCPGYTLAMHTGTSLREPANTHLAVLARRTQLN